MAVTASLQSLKPSSTYPYRIVAKNSAGSSYGQDQTFATPPAAQPSSSDDQVVLSDHPVAYYDMSAAGTEADLSGNGHTGTYKGAAPVSAPFPTASTRRISTRPAHTPVGI